MKGGAHAQLLLSSTESQAARSIPISQIASVGHPLTAYADVEKVQRMRARIRAGNPPPPVRIEKLTPEKRDTYGVSDPTKKYFLTNGHHRLAAAKLEGKRTIKAVDFDRSM
jgi:uncharacterized ParB-like nuclease family protein